MADEGVMTKSNWVGCALVANPAVCWQYPWSTTGRYANISYRGRKTSAHRLICEIAHGDPLPGQIARHSCDNPKCCNPHHLAWGTQGDNIADALDRGRFALGAKHGRAKLDDAKVKAIRQLLKCGESMNRVARHFGVSRPCIKQIVTGRTWAHVA